MANNPNYPKSFSANGYPIHTRNPSGSLTRVESMLTPAKFRSRFIKGIQQVILDKLGITYSNEELKDFITRAINQVELELNMSIVAQQYVERQPWDASLYSAYVFTQVGHPVLRLDDFSIVSANNDKIFQFPAQWIDASGFFARRVCSVPLLAIQSTGDVVTSQPTALGWSLLHARLGINFIPGYFEISYVSGICLDANSVPVVVNELIGTVAAITLLSGIAPLNMYTTVSLGQDGISQSSANAGTQVFALRMQELQLQKDKLMKELKRVFSRKFYMQNI